MGLGMGIPWVSDPVQMTIIKNMVTPKFAGTNEDWSKFIIDWQEYVIKLGQGRKLTDAQKLSLLEPCLDETNRRELKLLRKTAAGAEIPFNGFWAKLTDRYGEDVRGNARKRWKDLALQNTGRIGLVEWRDFRVKFLDVWGDIDEASPEEAYQMFMGKMPQFIGNWVIEEQERRRRKAPKILVSPVIAAAQQIRDNMEEMAGDIPRKVTDKGAGLWLIEFADEEPIHKMLELNGKKLRGGSVLKVVRLEEKLTVEEAMIEIERKFSVREKQDSLGGPI